MQRWMHSSSPILIVPSHSGTSSQSNGISGLESAKANKLSISPPLSNNSNNNNNLVSSESSAISVSHHPMSENSYPLNLDYLEHIQLPQDNSISLPSPDRVARIRRFAALIATLIQYPDTTPQPVPRVCQINVIEGFKRRGMTETVDMWCNMRQIMVLNITEIKYFIHVFYGMFKSFDQSPIYVGVKHANHQTYAWQRAGKGVDFLVPQHMQMALWVRRVDRETLIELI